MPGLLAAVLPRSMDQIRLKEAQLLPGEKNRATKQWDIEVRNDRHAIICNLILR